MTIPPSSSHQPEVSGTTTAAATGSDATRRPVVLVTGATGQIGGHLVDALKQDPSIDLRAAVRRPEQGERFAAKGVRAVRLDLDDYDGLAQALRGVDRLFLVAGYTVDMRAQGKNIVDSAKAAGVQHIVHVGTFTQPDHPMARYVGHMVWHQLVESYIEASGLGYTHCDRTSSCRASSAPSRATPTGAPGGPVLSAGWTASTSRAWPRRCCASPSRTPAPATT